MLNELPDKLNVEEFTSILKKYQETKLDNYRNKIIIHNLRLVAKVVYCDFKNLEYDKEDIFNVGVIGLIKAVENYDFMKKAAFSNFAMSCIKNEILHFLRNERKVLKTLSFDNIIINNNGDSLELEKLLCDNNSQFDNNVCDSLLFNKICEKINTFKPRDADILKSYFGIGVKPIKQKEIALKYGLSISFISRKIQKCIEKLKIDEELQIHDYKIKSKIKGNN